MRKKAFTDLNRARILCGRQYPKGDLAEINTVNKIFAIKEMITSQYGPGKILLFFTVVANGRRSFPFEISGFYSILIG